MILIFSQNRAALLQLLFFHGWQFPPSQFMIPGISPAATDASRDNSWVQGLPTRPSSTMFSDSPKRCPKSERVGLWPWCLCRPDLAMAMDTVGPGGDRGVCFPAILISAWSGSCCAPSEKLLHKQVDVTVGRKTACISIKLLMRSQQIELRFALIITEGV